jgi:hypothetical protein
MSEPVSPGFLATQGTHMLFSVVVPHGATGFRSHAFENPGVLLNHVCEGGGYTRGHICHNKSGITQRVEPGNCNALAMDVAADSSWWAPWARYSTATTWCTILTSQLDSAHLCLVVTNKDPSGFQ